MSLFILKKLYIFIIIFKIYFYKKKQLYIYNGDWGIGPIPNPQSPIPNPQSPIIPILFDFYIKII